MNLDFPKSLEVLGGYPKFQFVEIADISFLQKSKSLVNEAIVLKAEKVWSEGLANPKSLELIVEPEDRTGSMVFDVKIEAFISCDDLDSELLAILEYMSLKRFVVLLMDGDAQKLVGTLETPLRFKFSYASGKSGKDPKGYKFTFFNKMLIAPRVYCPI
jgi:hypothetical protein